MHREESALQRVGYLGLLALASTAIMIGGLLLLDTILNLAQH